MTDMVTNSPVEESAEITPTEIVLSKLTVDILKNMANINPRLHFAAGKLQKTMNPGPTVLVEATLDVDFPIEFSIYELNRFVSVLSLPTMKEARILFDNDRYCTFIGNNDSKLRYYFADIEFPTPPDKEIKLPSIDFSTTLSADTLDGFFRACGSLGHNMFEIKIKDGVAYLTTYDKDNPSANKYEVNLGLTTSIDRVVQFKTENVKILPGDYTLEICEKGISRWHNDEINITYFIGTEATGK